MQACSGNNGHAFIDRTAFHDFLTTLDGEMKRLNGTGNYLKKNQALPITIQQEDRLWELGLLGDSNPRVLLNTIVFQIGFFCALRSGNEHRRLRHKPSQIELVEPPGGRSYIVYREDISKTNQGGISSRKKAPKEICQYANLDNPSRCFIRLYKLYNSKCPKDRPAKAFYLTPLAKYREDVWFSKTPLGHNMLGKVVSDMMKQAGFDGHFTNHSLRVSLATRLFDAEVDEQLIMNRTGHSSTDGVRAYKRASTKLKEITSDVLNQKTVSSKAENKHATQLDPDCPPEKKPRIENEVQKTSPTFQITGGTNITININSK